MSAVPKALQHARHWAKCGPKQVRVIAWEDIPEYGEVSQRPSPSTRKKERKAADALRRLPKYVPPLVTTRDTKMQHSRGALREFIVHVPSLGWEYFRYTYETPALGGRKAGSGKGSKFRICIDYATYTLAEILETYYTPVELEEVKRKHNVK